ncbi:MAG TPA: hypothetical protein VME92_18810 [Acetobacteraceae bacterium]|nr:hypothetical protein [Acetobacteraceae bacterium]
MPAIAPHTLRPSLPAECAIAHTQWEHAHAEVMRALARSARVVLLVGEAGSGKTMVLQSLAAAIAAGGSPARLVPRPRFECPQPEAAVYLLDEAGSADPDAIAALSQPPAIAAVLALLPSERGTLCGLLHDPVTVTLGPIAADEIAAFLQRRLVLAEIPSDFLSHGALGLLRAHGAGNARDLTMLLSSAVSLAALDGAAQVEEAHAAEAISLRSGVVAAEPDIAPDEPAALAAATPAPPPTVAPEPRPTPSPLAAGESLAAGAATGTAHTDLANEAEREPALPSDFEPPGWDELTPALASLRAELGPTEDETAAPNRSLPASGGDAVRAAAEELRADLTALIALARSLRDGTAPEPGPPAREDAPVVPIQGAEPLELGALPAVPSDGSENPATASGAARSDECVPGSADPDDRPAPSISAARADGWPRTVTDTMAADAASASRQDSTSAAIAEASSGASGSIGFAPAPALAVATGEDQAAATPSVRIPGPALPDGAKRAGPGMAGEPAQPTSRPERRARGRLIRSARQRVPSAALRRARPEARVDGSGRAGRLPLGRATALALAAAAVLAFMLIRPGLRQRPVGERPGAPERQAALLIAHTGRITRLTGKADATGPAAPAHGFDRRLLARLVRGGTEAGPPLVPTVPVPPDATRAVSPIRLAMVPGPWAMPTGGAPATAAASPSPLLSAPIAPAVAQTRPVSAWTAGADRLVAAALPRPEPPPVVRTVEPDVLSPEPAPRPARVAVSAAFVPTATIPATGPLAALAQPAAPGLSTPTAAEIGRAALPPAAGRAPGLRPVPEPAATFARETLPDRPARSPRAMPAMPPPPVEAGGDGEAAPIATVATPASPSSWWRATRDVALATPPVPGLAHIPTAPIAPASSPAEAGSRSPMPGTSASPRLLAMAGTAAMVRPVAVSSPAAPPVPDRVASAPALAAVAEAPRVLPSPEAGGPGAKPSPVLARADATWPALVPIGAEIRGVPPPMPVSPDRLAFSNALAPTPLASTSDAGSRPPVPARVPAAISEPAATPARLALASPPALLPPDQISASVVPTPPVSATAAGLVPTVPPDLPAASTLPVTAPASLMLASPPAPLLASAPRPSLAIASAAPPRSIPAEALTVRLPPRPQPRVVTVTARVFAPAMPPAPIVAGLLKRAEARLVAGDVRSARALYEKAAAAGSGAAALGVAKTFDPVFLAAIAATDVMGDRRVAARWYRKAAQLREAQADMRPDDPKPDPLPADGDH